MSTTAADVPDAAGHGEGRGADGVTFADLDARDAAKQRKADRWELVATVIMAVAAVATAWAAFQSTKWGGVQANSYAAAGAARTESAKAATLAGQQISIDVLLFTQWLDALNADLVVEPSLAPEGGAYDPQPGFLSTVLYDRMRTEFQPALDAWIATEPLQDPDAPRTPFTMEEYVVQAELDAAELEAQADELGAEARQANQRGDNYVALAVAFASVLFFAGVSTKLESERARVAMLALAIVILAGAVVVLATLPVEI